MGGRCCDPWVREAGGVPGVVVHNSTDVAWATGSLFRSLREGEEKEIDQVRSPSAGGLVDVDYSSFLSLFRLYFEGGQLT